MNTNEQFGPVGQVEQLDMMPEDNSVPSAIRNIRLQRILAYQAQALSKRNLLRSNLATTNSGLMRMALRLEETIDELMAQAPLTEERLQLLFKAIDAHLRVTRQIDRFAQVELRRVVPRESSPKNKVDVECWIENSSEPDTSAGEDLNN
jgi:hypothetical protein